MSTPLIIEAQFFCLGLGVLNLSHLDLEFMSINYPTLAHIRHFSSLFTNLRSTTVDNSLQITPFYAKQTQFQKWKMNINTFITMRYTKKGQLIIQTKQSQFKANKAKNKPNLTQFKANSNPIYRLFLTNRQKFDRMGSYSKWLNPRWK